MSDELHDISVERMNRDRSAEDISHKRSRMRGSIKGQHKTFATSPKKKPSERPAPKDPLLQGQKHSDNPWIQKVTKKEEQIAKMFSRKIITVKRKPQEGADDKDQEAEILAQEFSLDIFKELSKKEYRQLISYDTWEHDLPPELWVAKCRASAAEAHGISPVFTGKTYTWEPVKVLGYNAAARKFRISVQGTGQVKEVTRLSLMFYEEDREQFVARLKECRERRENVESELRFQGFVDALPSAAVPHIPAQMLEAVLLRSTVKDCNNKHVEEIVAKLKKVIDAVYRRAIKKCLVLEKIVSREEILRLQESNVPIKLNAKAAPNVGVIDAKRASRSKRVDFWVTGDDPLGQKSLEEKKIAKLLQRVERKAGKLTELKAKRKERRVLFMREYDRELLKFGNAGKIVNSFIDDFQKICTDFKKRRLLQLDAQRLQLPTRCSQFMLVQDKRINTTITDILNNWRFQILYNMRNKVGKKFVFDVADKQKYEESVIRKLIHKLDLMFHNHLEEFYLVSIGEFVRFVRSFTRPEGEDVWRISAVPLIEIDIRYTGSDKKKESKKDDDHKHKHKKDDKKKKELMQKEVKELIFKPDIGQCKADILSLLTKIASSTKKINVLETEDFNVFLTESKDPAYELTADSEAIARARETICRCIDQCMVEPNELLRKFKKYEFLMTTESASVKKTMEKEPPPNSDELKELLNKFSRANYEVQTLATDLVRFSMFQVNTEEVKRYLAARAQKLKQALLYGISKHCQKTVKDILNSYKQLLSKLEDKPTSKDAYKELKMYLKNSNKRMDELKAQHERVRLRMELLEDNLIKIDKDDERNFWDVHQYPSKLRSKIAKGNNNLINYEEQIRIELENQKDQFDKDMNACQLLFDQITVFTDIEEARKEYRSAFELHDKIEKAVIKAREINDDEGLLEMKKTEYNALDRLSKSFQPFYSLIKLSEEIQISIEGWMTNPFISLSPLQIESEIKDWNASLDDINNLLAECKDQAEVSLQLKDVVANFATHLELIKCLRSEAMKEEEFGEIGKRTPLSLKANDDTYSLNTLIKKGAEEYMEEIREIWERAERKLDLDKNLRHIKDDMHKKKIELAKYHDTDIYVIQNYKQIMDYIDEQIARTQGMLNSPYMVGALRKNCTAWTAKFGLMSDILEEFKKCQQTWTHLAPIFAAEDIRLTLKLESERFMDVHAKLKEEMDSICADNLIVSLLDKERLKEEFVRANSELELILRGLSDFFESKRKKFPRFYFISDEDLIRILSHAKQDLANVQPYLSKCFSGMKSFSISQPKHEITSVMSGAEETIELIRPLDIREGDKKGNIEIWLKELETILSETLQSLSKKAIKAYPAKKLEDFIFAWPAQVVLLATQVHFTSQTEAALNNPENLKASLEQLKEELNTRIEKYIKMVRGNASPLHCDLLESLLILEIHGQGVLQELVARQVSSAQEFNWLIQLRHAFAEDTVKINLFNSSQPYGYEYNGDSSRLVITPLTERCFRTLMTAKQLHCGGALVGSTESGKTETIKDLAKVLGTLYVTFNGSGALDCVSLTKFFKGLSMSGAWCCFDEFNRIPSDVLSVLASQISAIQEALSRKGTLLHFMNEEIVLNQRCGINITMNKSFILNRELPDNLKALFRSCAITAPDNELIAEVLLHSYGFATPKAAAKKLTTTLSLCKAQLSASSHCSFSLRILKQILSTAKTLKQEAANEEDVVIRQALDSVNLPKLNAGDLVLYEGIVGDVFSAAVEVRSELGVVKAVVEALRREHLQAKDEFVRKCAQLHKSIEGMRGVVVVGESFSGKTTAIRVLKNALSDMNQEIELQTLNPRAVTLEQLFGYFDRSHSWVDGILSKALRDVPERGRAKWLVCDGPVDSQWMEAVNTTLDDSRKLCLGSGTAIGLDAGVRMLLEAEDLCHASPGITSRCSVVFMERVNLGWEALVKSYCEELPELLGGKRVKGLEENMIALLVPVVAFVNRWCKFPVEMSLMHLVKNFLNILECFIAELREEGAKLPSDMDSAIPNMLIFATVWGFAGALDETLQAKFKEFLMDLLNITDIKIKYKLDIDVPPIKFAVKLPESQDLFNLAYNRSGNRWLAWIPESTLAAPPSTPLQQLLVPTPETERMHFLLTLLVPRRRHVLFLGPSNSGKSFVVSHTLKQCFSNSKYMNVMLNLSAFTTSNQLQEKIECKLEKRGRKIYFGPLGSKQGVVFVDDLSMPQRSVYGTQGAIELLRQWMDYGGWYDVAGKEFKHVVDLVFVGAITPAAADRKNINMRYVRHYNVVSVRSYDQERLNDIFEAIVNWKFQDYSIVHIKDLLPKIAKGTVDLYFALQRVEQLKLVPSKPYYAYTLRDITRVFQGMALGRPQTSDQLIRLWTHETTRAFHDKLSTPQDREAFSGRCKARPRSGLRRSGKKLGVRVCWYFAISHMNRTCMLKSLIRIFLSLWLSHILQSTTKLTNQS